MKNHTSGPWIFGPNANLHADTTLKECLRVCNPQINKTTAITWDESDARLISAAPDLLAFVERIARLPLHGEYVQLIDEARAAIAKATGEAQ